MTGANWPQMEVVASIEGEGMRCCLRSKADKWIHIFDYQRQKHLRLALSLRRRRWMQQVTVLLLPLHPHLWRTEWTHSLQYGKVNIFYIIMV